MKPWQTARVRQARGKGRDRVFVGKEEPREQKKTKKKTQRKNGAQMKGTREKVGEKCKRAREGPCNKVRGGVKRASVLVKMRWVIEYGRHPGSIWSELEVLPVL